VTALAAPPAAPAPPREARATPRWWRDVTALLTGSSVVVVLALWVTGHGLGSLVRHPADAFTSVGRLTGLVAADLLLIQVLLMARIPAVERSYGQDELARKHRLVGFWSLNLLLLHIVLITVGYSLSAGNNVLRELWTLVTTYPGMLLATASLAALVAVTVTSVRRARKRLRYESWHLIHLYAYLGVGFSVPHEIWTGADFTSSPLARLYWWGSYAAAAGAVLLYRVALPLYRTLRHRITVTSVARESSDVVTVRMAGRGLESLPVRAGQFFVFRFRDGRGWTRGNPYSLSAPLRGERLQITAKDLGAGSGRLARLRPGTKVLIEGPYGRLTGEQRTRTKLTMLACGIGITPMRALLEELAYAPGDATLVYRARSTPDLVFRKDLDDLAARRGVVVHYVTGPRRAGSSSWRSAGTDSMSDAEALLQLVPDLTAHDVFVCGPDPWMDAAVAATAGAGVPAAQVHQERFSW
jgi:predicted ferric reductase